MVWGKSTNRASQHTQHSHSSLSRAINAYLKSAELSDVPNPNSGRHHHEKLCYYLPPPVSAPAAPSDMLSGLLLEDALLFNATKKVSNTPDKLLFLSIIAGIWVGLGGVVAVSAAGGVPEDVRKQWVSLPKFLMGSFFAFALHFIALFGGELFTGNTMYLAIGWFNRVVSFRSLLFNWFVVYIGNWAGCLLVAYFLGYLTDLFGSEQYRIFLNEIVVGKLEDLGWGEIFLRGIGANAMVCIALVMGIAARDAAGKIMALWFPVVVFVLSGYEHCVANMIFCSLGLMYGGNSTIGRMWYNQSAAVCGNILGGVIFIGLVAHLMNHWSSPIFQSVPGAGTLAAQDVESSRRARDVPDMHPADVIARARCAMNARSVPTVPTPQEKEPEADLEMGTTPTEVPAVHIGVPERPVERCPCQDIPVEGHVEAMERRKAIRAMRETESQAA